MLVITMAKTYAAIQKQIEALQIKANAARQKEIAGVIARIKEAIQAYELTSEDLGFRAGGTAAPQRASGRRPGYRVFSDGQGNTWSGRGPRPRWIKELLAAGKSLDDLVQARSPDATARAKGSAAPRKTKASGRKLPPKYRDAAGNTWTGRGSQPRWLREAIAKGEKRESFAV